MRYDTFIQKSIKYLIDRGLMSDFKAKNPDYDDIIEYQSKEGGSENLSKPEIQEGLGTSIQERERILSQITEL